MSTPGSPQSLAQWSSLYREPNYTDAYSKIGNGFPVSNEAYALANNVGVVETWSDCSLANVQAIIAHQSDAAIITHLQAYLANENPGQPVVLRWCWEFNLSGKFNNGSGSSGPPNNTPEATASQFQQAWQVIWHDIHDPVGSGGVGATSAQIAMFWCPSGGVNNSSILSFYPGDAYVDHAGWDKYDESSQGFLNDESAMYSLESGSTSPIGATKDFWVGETGELQGGNQGTYLTYQTRAQIAVQYPRIKNIIYFDSDTNGNLHSLDLPGVSALGSFQMNTPEPVVTAPATSSPTPGPTNTASPPASTPTPTNAPTAGPSPTAAPLVYLIPQGLNAVEALETSSPQAVQVVWNQPITPPASPIAYENGLSVGSTVVDTLPNAAHDIYSGCADDWNEGVATTVTFATPNPIVTPNPNPSMTAAPQPATFTVGNAANIAPAMAIAFMDGSGTQELVNVASISGNVVTTDGSGFANVHPTNTAIPVQGACPHGIGTGAWSVNELLNRQPNIFGSPAPTSTDSSGNLVITLKQNGVVNNDVHVDAILYDDELLNQAFQTPPVEVGQAIKYGQQVCAEIHASAYTNHPKCILTPGGSIYQKPATSGTYVCTSTTPGWNGGLPSYDGQQGQCRQFAYLLPLMAQDIVTGGHADIIDSQAQGLQGNCDTDSGCTEFLNATYLEGRLLKSTNTLSLVGVGTGSGGNNECYTYNAIDRAMYGSAVDPNGGLNAGFWFNIHSIPSVCNIPQNDFQQAESAIEYLAAGAPVYPSPFPTANPSLTISATTPSSSTKSVNLAAAAGFNGWMKYAYSGYATGAAEDDTFTPVMPSANFTAATAVNGPISSFIWTGGEVDTIYKSGTDSYVLQWPAVNGHSETLKMPSGIVPQQANIYIEQQCAPITVAATVYKANGTIDTGVTPVSLTQAGNSSGSIYDSSVTITFASPLNGESLQVTETSGAPLNSGSCSGSGLVGLQALGMGNLATPAPSPTPTATATAVAFIAPPEPAFAPNPFNTPNNHNSPDPYSAAELSQLFTTGGGFTNIMEVSVPVPNDTLGEAAPTIPVYETENARDPLFTIVCTLYGGTGSGCGQSVHLKAGAMPQDGYTNGGEGHMEFVNPGANSVIGFYKATSVVPSSAGTYTVGTAGICTFSAYPNVSTACQEGGTAGGLPVSGLLIKPDVWLAADLASTDLGHQIAITACARNAAIWPSVSAVGNTPGCPPEGATIRLNKTDLQINAYNVPAAEKVLLLTMAHYGLIVTDQNATPWSMFFEDDNDRTSQGQTANWPALISQLCSTEDPGLNCSSTIANGSYHIQLPVPFAQSDLQIVYAPGVAVPTAPPTATPAPTSTPTATPGPSASPYINAINADSPWFYSPLNAAAGSTTTADLGSGGNTAHYVGVAAPTAFPNTPPPGPYSPSGSTSNAIFLLNPTSNYPSTAAMTMEGWITPAAPDFAFSYDSASIVDNRDPATSSTWFNLGIHGDTAGSGHAVCQFQGSGIEADSPASSISAGGLYYLACSYNQTVGTTLYVNGVSAGTSSATYFTPWGSGNPGIAIGGLGSSATAGTIQQGSLSGTVSNVGLYTTALSSARILAHYNAGIANVAPTPTPSPTPSPTPPPVALGAPVTGPYAGASAETALCINGNTQVNAEPTIPPGYGTASGHHMGEFGQPGYTRALLALYWESGSTRIGTVGASFSTGNTSPITTLASNVTIPAQDGATTATFASASGFAVGNLVELGHSPGNNGNNASSADAPTSLIATITGISGNTISLGSARDYPHSLPLDTSGIIASGLGVWKVTAYSTWTGDSESYGRTGGGYDNYLAGGATDTSGLPDPFAIGPDTAVAGSPQGLSITAQPVPTAAAYPNESPVESHYTAMTSQNATPEPWPAVGGSIAVTVGSSQENAVQNDFPVTIGSTGSGKVAVGWVLSGANSCNHQSGVCTSGTGGVITIAGIVYLEGSQSSGSATFPTGTNMEEVNWVGNSSGAIDKQMDFQYGFLAAKTRTPANLSDNSIAFWTLDSQKPYTPNPPAGGLKRNEMDIQEQFGNTIGDAQNMGQLSWDSNGNGITKGYWLGDFESGAEGGVYSDQSVFGSNNSNYPYNAYHEYGGLWTPQVDGNGNFGVPGVQTNFANGGAPPSGNACCQNGNGVTTAGDSGYVDGIPNPGHIGTADLTENTAGKEVIAIFQIENGAPDDVAVTTTTNSFVVPNAYASTVNVTVASFSGWIQMLGKQYDIHSGTGVNEISMRGMLVGVNNATSTLTFYSMADITAGGSNYGSTIPSGATVTAAGERSHTAAQQYWVQYIRQYTPMTSGGACT